jgi:capsular polysaccharide biosynthesis protein
MEAIMELADLSRAIARYGWLIVAMVVIGEAVVALHHVGKPTTYTASARLVLDTPDPESRAESAAIADTAKAIATSPSQVTAALTQAGVTGRRAGDVARDMVSVRALGSSGIVQMSVRDENPAAAAAIANALAAEVINTRREVTTGESRETLRVLDGRISNLNRRISALDARISSLAVQTETAASSSAANSARSKGDEAERLRDSLAQQRTLVEAERVSLLSSDALRPKPQIISRASRPTSADPSRLLADLVLGALVGLIVGIGGAALLEFVRPTITGGRALAGAFNAPLLGTLSEPENEWDPAATDTAARLALAADAAGVTTISLLAVGPPVDLGTITTRLQHAAMSAAMSEEEQTFARTAEGQTVQSPWTPTTARAGRGVQVAALHPSELSLKSLGEASLAARGGELTGIAVVSPMTLSKREASEAVNLLRRTSLPLVGVIVVESTPLPPSRYDSVLDRLEQLRSSA